MNFLSKFKIGSKFKYQLVFLLFALLYWNLVIRIAIFLRILGVRENDFREVFSKGMSFFVDEVIKSSVIISVFAFISWFIIHFVYPNMVRKYRMRKLTIGIVIFDTAIFFIIGLSLGFVHYSIDNGYAVLEIVTKLRDFMFNSTTLFFLIVLFIGSYVYQLLFTTLHRIGHGSLGKIMMGYYQKPREENQIFMFLDLQSSSKFAEILGHEKYSYFIQDCFRYLTNPLLKTNGRVYQFVGDEAVVTWNADKANNFKRAVDFYYEYEKDLNKRKNYFEKKYGLMPMFTASINSGKVMAAEVGEIKQELAFHGDVLNTAARIQKQCKRYRKNILVTRDFASQLIKEKTKYKLKYVDIVKFVGKDRVVKIYEVFKEEQ